MVRTLTAFLAVVAPSLALAQPLVCPATPAGTCSAYHFHVQMFRPDTKGFADFSGINQFASQSACDRARDAAMAHSLAVVDHIKKTQNDQQYQPDRVGPCHCDMTIDKTSPNYLTDLQRTAQLRTAEEIRQRVRERLMDTEVPTDSDLIRGLWPASVPFALLNAPRLTPLPARQIVTAVTNSPDDLRLTKTVDTTPATVATLDLPLVEVTAEMPLSAAEPAKTEETSPTADDSAEEFVNVETQRIQDVLKESASIADEAVKARVLEACMQRIQLLSNLRALIQGSGARSRLATAARNAKSDPDRLALVMKLFGPDVAPHWAPKEAQAVVLTPLPEDAERELRDTSGKFSDQQRRRALYDVLARTQPTEEQQLWLTTVVDTFLQS
jgi:hypothetical protein